MILDDLKSQAKFLDSPLYVVKCVLSGFVLDNNYTNPVVKCNLKHAEVNRFV